MATGAHARGRAPQRLHPTTPHVTQASSKTSSWVPRAKTRSVKLLELSSQSLRGVSERASMRSLQLIATRASQGKSRPRDLGTGGRTAASAVASVSRSCPSPRSCYTYLPVPCSDLTCGDALTIFPEQGSKRVCCALCVTDILRRIRVHLMLTARPTRSIFPYQPGIGGLYLLHPVSLAGTTSSFSSH